MKNNLQKIKQEKLVAIVRAEDTTSIERVVESLYAGGFRIVEVTLNTEGALDAISRIRSNYNDILVGAGTVLDKEAAQHSAEAGAQFILAPTLDEETIRTGKDAGVPVVPGVMTPTEALHAYRWGAEMVKVFPVSSVGKDFFRQMRGPLPFISMMAVGGINPVNAADYLKAGWNSIGIGSSLVNQQRIDDGKFDEIEQIARQFIAIRNENSSSTK